MESLKESTSTTWLVVTSINNPTKCIQKISEWCENGNGRAVVVGDTKTPRNWCAPGIDFLDVNAQKSKFNEFADVLPYNHYCRKNLGYLYAISGGADRILETDDDNYPYDEFGLDLSEITKGNSIDSGYRGWVNVYRYFSNQMVWPRGLPLEVLQNPLPAISSKSLEAKCAIQQYLADGDPDVDAVSRLIFNHRLQFSQIDPVILGEGQWCPFNSQNTVFYSHAFPLLYLPCYVSFRMTDIWRSLVAQVCLWWMGSKLSFHSSTVYQDRNAHDLLKDFQDEVPGYLMNEKIRASLEFTLATEGRRCKTLNDFIFKCWEGLYSQGIIEERELHIIERWLSFFK